MVDRLTQGISRGDLAPEHRRRGHLGALEALVREAGSHDAKLLTDLESVPLDPLAVDERAVVAGQVGHDHAAVVLLGDLRVPTRDTFVHDLDVAITRATERRTTAQHEDRPRLGTGGCAQQVLHAGGEGILAAWGSDAPPRPGSRVDSS